MKPLWSSCYLSVAAQFIFYTFCLMIARDRNAIGVSPTFLPRKCTCTFALEFVRRVAYTLRPLLQRHQLAYYSGLHAGHLLECQPLPGMPPREMAKGHNTICSNSMPSTCTNRVGNNARSGR